jgi:Predicted nucleotide-binding protein containing TIR-like domain
MKGRRARIFLGSSSDGENEALLDALGELLTTEPNSFLVLPWRVTAKPGESIITTLITNTERADFAVLLLTPDDRASVRGETRRLPRDNLLFELGLFMGRLGPKRVLMVCPEGDVKIPSDLGGIERIKYNPSDGEPSEYLWPAARKIKTAFGERLLDHPQQISTTELQPKKADLVIDVIETSHDKPIGIYRDKRASYDWFSEFAEQIKSFRGPSLNPKLLYYAPSGAKLWRRVSSGNRAQIALRQAFVNNY